MEILEKKKTGTELYKDFDKLFGASMVEKGYKRVLNHFKAPEYFKRLTDSGLFATVINHTSRDYTGGINVDMSVGVAYDKAEKLLYELIKELYVIPYTHKWPTTTQCGIYCLSADKSGLDCQQSLKTEKDVVPSVDSMINLVETVAEPFFSKFQTLDYYVEYLKTTAGIERDRIVPVVYYLMGQRDEAENYIQSRLNDTKHRGYIDIGDSVFLKNFHSLP